MLRIILSWHLKKKPLEIEFIHEKNSKPAIAGNPVYFNLTHTRDAFAIAISKQFHVGIDLEDMDRKLDYKPIIRSCFSSGEQAFILERREEASDRFFMLWTRKEAYLKALGTGIITNMGQIGVIHKNRFVSDGIQKNIISHSVCNSHFLYSRRINNYYLSVAAPEKSGIRLIQIEEKNLTPLLRRCNTEQ